MERGTRTGCGTTARALRPPAAVPAGAGGALVSVLLVAASLACGPAASPATTPADDPAALPDDAVVARLGCTAITAGDVRRWQRIVLAAEPIAGPPGGGPTAPRGFEATCDDLVNRTVISRLGVLLGLQIDDREIDLGLALLAARSDRTVEQLLAAARDRGLAVAELRELVAGDLQRFSLLVGVMLGEGWPRHEDVVSECRRRFGDGGCTAEQMSLVRDDLRQALTVQWMSTRGAEWLAERRAELEARAIEEGPEGCVERPAGAASGAPADGGASEPDGPPPRDVPVVDVPVDEGTSARGGP